MPSHDQPRLIPFNQKPPEQQAEVVDLANRHRDFLEHYAKGLVRIEPAPDGLDTFAFDLETNTIYVNDRFYKSRGYSEERSLFALLHEIEHFTEKKDLLTENDGVAVFEKYIARIKASRAFGLMDNLVADIRENRSVVARTNTNMAQTEQIMYQEDLFPSTDFTAAPKHIQFCQTLLREARVPEEMCTVDPGVRAALDELAAEEGLLEEMTNPDIPMSLRLELQDVHVWPKVQKFLEQDMEEQKKKQEEEKKKREEAGKAKQEGDKDGQEKDNSTEGSEGNKEESAKQSDEGEGNTDKSNAEGEPGSKPSDKSGEGQLNTSTSQSTDPNIVFKEYYDALDARSPDAVPLDEIEKAVQKWKKQQGKETPAEKADAEYAKKLGVSKEDLQKYRDLVREVEGLIHPETSASVMEEMREVFLRIIRKRIQNRLSPKYPLPEGDELLEPAELYTEVHGGNLEPKVWGNVELKERRGNKCGEVELTLICDRSSSMMDGNGEKAKEQKRSAVLVLEVLKEFADLCDESKMNMDTSLQIATEVYTFSQSEEDRLPLKPMSKELGEAERIKIMKRLEDCPGGTTDYVCLDTVRLGVTDEQVVRIKDGRLKKIVIVMTDGDSKSPADVQAQLQALNAQGVVVIGIGITASGRPVLTTYAPNAKVAEMAEQLPLVLEELLKEHLERI